MSAGQPLAIASFKLQFAERRVRVVPAHDPSGGPFDGPGIDLVGDETSESFALAAPILAWLQAREPVQVRSLSLDVARRRLLVTLESEPRPRVVKIDPAVDAGAATELLSAAGPLLQYLSQAVAPKLAARAARKH